MTEQQITRRLTAILAADIAGYSSRMEADEAGTVAALRQTLKSVVTPSATTSMALTCRWRSRPQHHKQTSDCCWTCFTVGSLCLVSYLVTVPL
jgi:hypothetical protein